MSKKHQTLIIVFIVLVAAAWFFTDKNKNTDIAYSSNFLANIDIAKVDKISVVNADNETIFIQKTNGTWFVQPGSLPTETILIDALIEKLTIISEADWSIASVNSDKKDNFEVGEQGTTITLSQGEDELISFVVGKVNSSYSGNYLSRANDINTYLVPETFVRALDTDSWADKTVLSFNADNVEVIELEYPTQTISLTNVADSRGEVFWRTTLPYFARLKKDKVEEWITSISNLEAISADNKTIELATALTLSIKGEDINEIITISEQDPETKNYVVKKSNANQTFYISKKAQEDLFKQIKDWQ